MGLSVPMPISELQWLTRFVSMITPELGKGGGVALGARPPTEFYVGGQCPHKILQQQAHYSGVCGRLISEGVTYIA